MEVYEITGFQSGVSNEGVNFLSPKDSFQNIFNGFIYRQVLQSRPGFGYFAPRLLDESRIYGIFEHILPDSTKELLVVDANFLYKYNIATGVFDQIPFAGSMIAYAGFNIIEKDLYVSGTSYPEAPFLSDGVTQNPEYDPLTQGARFVFTGEGINASNGSSIFFYNGTDVRNFTNIVDNPNYAAPPGVILTKANYVLWFNERLNFIVPYDNNQPNYQGILYSGIRTTNGNGDKFNVAGSGLLNADTFEDISGVNILGQVLCINFIRSNWTAEKTKDAFNPYFIRKVPSVEGTNAKFSAVSWYDQVKSIGKTGIIGTDGRQSLRIDNKIPNFTQDEIDTIDFNLTYGGFDRNFNQFLWSYKEKESETDTQNKVLVNNYEENTWSIYDQRFSVFGQTNIGLNLVWNQIDETSGDESWSRWDTTEDVWNKIGLKAGVQKTLAGDDLGFIYQYTEDFDDYISKISMITPGSTTTLTIDATGFQEGDFVTIENVEGMTEINNFDDETNTEISPPYQVLSATPTSVTILLDSTLFSAYTPDTGTISKVINFSAETIPFNPYRSQGLRCYISHIEFLIDNNGGSLRLDIFEDEEETPFKSDVLCLPNQESTKSREWITVTVDNEANFMTFKMKQTSPSVQLRITSVRIHCSPAGYTSG